MMGGLFWYISEAGTRRCRSSPRPLLAVPNVTAHATINGQRTNHLIMFYFFSFKFVLIENATEKNGRQNGRMDNDAAR